MIFFITGFFIWLTAWIGFEMVKYNYNKRVRPFASDWIYNLEAHWELHKINVRIKANQLKQRDTPVLVEDLEGWDLVRDGKRVETIITTELVQYDDNLSILQDK